VYVILEAHHRYDDDAVDDLWSLIGRVYVVHPKLMVAVHNPDIITTVRITLIAWQRRQTYKQHRSNHCQCVDSSNDSVPPAWISELCQKFDLPEVSSTFAAESMVQEPVIDTSQPSHFDFDFESMDWSFWENSSLEAALYDIDP
jgi:hypothetical protein